MTEFCIDAQKEFTERLFQLQRAVVESGGTEDLAYDVRLVASEISGNVFRYSQKKQVRICFGKDDELAYVRIYGDVTFDDCCTCPSIQKDRGRGMWLIRSLPRYRGFEKKNGVLTIMLAVVSQ